MKAFSFKTLDKRLRPYYKYLVNINLTSSLSYFQEKKKSQSLHILGSGSSILKIKDWDRVQKDDTLGFNFLFISRLQAKYYFIEPHSSVNQLYIDGFSLDPEYFMARDILIKNRRSSKQLMMALKALNIPYKTFKSMHFLAGDVERLSILASSKMPRRFIADYFHWSQGVASIEEFALLAARVGYREIVFSGVDLLDDTYFYEFSEFSTGPFSRIIERLKSESRATAVHPTASREKCYGALTVIDVLKVYNAIFSENGIRMCVSNEESALAEFLPVKSYN